MLPINKQNLEQFLIQHPISPSFQAYLQEFPIPASLKLKGMDATNLFKIIFKINGLKVDLNDDKTCNELQKNFRWKKWELGLFVWIVVYYVFITQKNINELNRQDYEFFNSIFLHKSILKLQHQILSLCPPRTTQRQEWSEDQEQHLKELCQQRMNKNKSLDWKFISFCLFATSKGKWLKPYAQCRQKWNNHFDPQVTKQPWTKEEELLLLQRVIEIGKKWSTIAKYFKGRRTEHMVKNRYNSLIKKTKETCCQVSQKRLQKKIISQILRSLNLRAKRTEIKKQDLNEENFEDFSQQNEMASFNTKPIKIQEEDDSILEPQMMQNSESNQSNFSSRLPSLLPSVQTADNERKFKDLFEFDYYDTKTISYDDKALRPIIDDVVEKVGCGHAELLDMYLESQSQWKLDSASLF